MPLSEEVKNWSEEMKSHGFVDDDLRPFLARADQNEKLENALKGTISATKDYKEKMDSLAKQEADAKALADANVALHQELTRWKITEADPKVAKAEKLMAEQAKLTARLSERANELREKYGIEDQDIMNLLEATKYVRAEAPAAAADVGATVTQQGKFVSSEEFDRVALSMPRIAARLEKLGRQFDKLYSGTSKEFDPESVLELAERESVSLDDAFSKLYDVPARKAQLSESAFQKRLNDEVAKRTAEIQAKYASSPAYVRPDSEGSLISKLIESKKPSAETPLKGQGENAAGIQTIREAAKGAFPEDAISRYVSISRKGSWREKAAQEAGEKTV